MAAATTKPAKASALPVGFDIAAWVAKSRASQGLAPTVTDPAVLDFIAEAVAAARTTTTGRSG